jgi:hypothetical protein
MGAERPGHDRPAGRVVRVPTASHLVEAEDVLLVLLEAIESPGATASPHALTPSVARALTDSRRW